MDDALEFAQQRSTQIQNQGENKKLLELTAEWRNESLRSKYSYHFDWLGRPIIQYPQDMIAMQQIIFDLKPDLIIETGIARGGSLIFYSSLLELNAMCGGPKNAKLIGIDIDIRPHNKKAINEHAMSSRIEMIEGSSTDPKILGDIKAEADQAKTVLICLDSNHTHAHVLDELKCYAPLVSKGSYLVVFDTVIEDSPNDLSNDRPWSHGNNPKTAVQEFLQTCQQEPIKFIDGLGGTLEVDSTIENQFLITVCPSGYLRRC